MPASLFFENLEQGENQLKCLNENFKNFGFCHYVPLLKINISAFCLPIFTLHIGILPKNFGFLIVSIWENIKIEKPAERISSRAGFCLSTFYDHRDFSLYRFLILLQT